ncbi:MAG: hypothetical protein MZW92_05740 [Comamonadaceae bacterium]|nr:hypothetical protein [Comamonadaceae bacterium]
MRRGVPRTRPGRQLLRRRSRGAGGRRPPERRGRARYRPGLRADLSARRARRLRGDRDLRRLRPAAGELAGQRHPGTGGGRIRRPRHIPRRRGAHRDAGLLVDAMPVPATAAKYRALRYAPETTRKSAIRAPGRHGRWQRAACPRPARV